VIGPIDGFGRSFSIQLSSHKINLVLVGRNMSKLKDLVDEIHVKYKTQVKIVVVDFGGDIIESMSRVDDAINDLDVGILINNIGVCYPYVRFFHEVDSQLLKNLIAVNVEGTTRMVSIVLPIMLKRKKGAIVNIGFGVAAISSKFLSTLSMLLPKHMWTVFQGHFMWNKSTMELMCSAKIMCNIVAPGRCNTSILDFHRSCPDCSYDLCISCCREL
jgi:NADP-dependent 3-hydroxy acid dehydrogenase YdfG